MLRAFPGRREEALDRIPREGMRYAQDAQIRFEGSQSQVEGTAFVPALEEVEAGKISHRDDRAGVVRPVAKIDGEDLLVELRGPLGVHIPQLAGETVYRTQGPRVLGAPDPRRDRQQLLQESSSRLPFRVAEGRGQAMHCLEGHLVFRP